MNIGPGCHFLPWDLPGPVVKASSVLAGRFFTTELQASPINLIFSTEKKNRGNMLKTLSIYFTKYMFHKTQII